MVSTRRKCTLYFLALVAVVWSISPVYEMFSASFMNPKELISHNLFPPTPNINNYLRLFGFITTTAGGQIFGLTAQVDEGLTNSAIVAILVMTITMAATIPAGYALGRLRLRGRTAMVGLLLGSRTLPPVSVALPYYFYFTALHIRGTIIGVTIIQMSITIPLVAWVLMGFFSALPRDIEMSARMDGCTRFQAFRRALLPLAAPGIAASAVIAFLFSWNDFFYSWLISSGSPAQTFNTSLTAFLGQASGSAPDPTIFAAAVVVQVVVAIVVAGILQKYITSLKIIDPGTVAQ
ncbi:MAG: carbohydrate ABC transporter permease [Nitrososphaerota archaeon]|nr:carbohydrate ABC transporter permease [Nitrososphaerota archaeon]